MRVAAERLVGPDWPLTGRTAELNLIEAGLSAGTAGGVVLVGGPGAGKTRLAREGVLRAADTGRDTDWAVATRSAAVVPFGALWHLLAGAPRVGASPLELLRQTAAQLTARAAGNAIVLGVDDADLLDDWSAALIHQLVLHGHAFVVATVRAGAPAPDAVTALWKDGLARRLNVRPLASAAVDELLGHALGPQIGERTRRHIRRVAAGHPLVLRELLAGGLEEGALIGDGGVWRWADGPRYGPTLVELVRGRLDTLSEPARTVVEVVAFGERSPRPSSPASPAAACWSATRSRRPKATAFSPVTDPVGASSSPARSMCTARSSGRRCRTAGPGRSASGSSTRRRKGPCGVATTCCGWARGSWRRVRRETVGC